MPQTDNYQSLVTASTRYSVTFNNGHLQSPPSRKIALLTCMDARIDPAKIFGLTEGDAHVIRNAGGRATDDAIRSLVVSHKLLGTLDWFVIQHTCCGMGLIDDETMGQLLANSLETAVYDGRTWGNPQVESSDNNKPGCDLGKRIDWYTFSDLRQTLLSDLAYIKDHPLVPSHIKIYGFIFDVKTGKLTPVVS